MLILHIMDAIGELIICEFNVILVTDTVHSDTDGLVCNRTIEAPYAFRFTIKIKIAHHPTLRPMFWRALLYETCQRHPPNDARLIIHVDVEDTPGP